MLKQTVIGLTAAFIAARYGGQYFTSGPTGPIVDLGYSVYEGIAQSNGQNQFLGIRFAAPPIGDLRFRRPQPPLSTKGIQSAKKFGSICYALGEGLVEGHSEDCLFLNIWAPSNVTSDSKLPVLFWIQGGGYNTNSQPNYNGSELVKAADNQMIFVALNYRVGPYGFLASEKVRRDGDLNAGLLDQRFALEWVQEHIKQFGGDKDRVVLMGASAGAGSAAIHMLAYGGKETNLFHAVIGVSPFFPGLMKLEDREYQFDLFVSRAGCDGAENSLACLRSKDSKTLQKANLDVTFPKRKGNAMFPYPPVVDGEFLTDNTQALFMQEKFVKVPAIFGVDTDEGTMFTPDLSTQTEVSDFFLDNFYTMYDKHIFLMNQRYPVPKENPFPDKAAYYAPSAAALGDMLFVCPGLIVSRAVSNHANSWVYRYNVLTPANKAASLGVAHTSEMTNVFGPGNTAEPKDAFNWPDISLTPILQAYYTNFVRFLDPNAKPVEGSVTWPKFEMASLERLLLQTNATTVEKLEYLQLDRCDLWRKLSSDLKQ
ncbi:hypothetical protein M422DRAFT_26556 [Sphaerobolus stellatus SS14]|nr:hypothetical protein M422DRAFT_26556 [Sphaerobolus stellatus SS14]